MKKVWRQKLQNLCCKCEFVFFKVNATTTLQVPALRHVCNGSHWYCLDSQSGLDKCASQQISSLQGTSWIFGQTGCSHATAFFFEDHEVVKQDLCKLCFMSTDNCGNHSHFFFFFAVSEISMSCSMCTPWGVRC